MKRGFTVIELLVIIAIIAIFAGLICAAVGRSNAKPEVINVQQTGTLESTGVRTITKVPPDQIEDFLSKVPANVKIVQVVPTYFTDRVHNYLVITEK